ncbi:hypothetical protein EST38_g2106 [Candolleomyces aberdarensis]|uniref:NACHT domain-containing protein n=1 Tax=Candolleomyces aberdarensis TaxID=2316362 RepID=A0A4Q2DVF0_9AGAR|nr:hypothetical protein EST38_g2106 [Candolleomyces aberdarensis]
MPHRLVIIDGLDECINSDQQSRVEKQYAEDQERVQVRVLELIRTLHSHNLPLCFLILSRPEPWIKRHIESRSFQFITDTLDLYQVGDHLEDVEKFVKDELARIAESLDPQPENNEEWPGEDIVNDFLRRAGGHMLYAATVIRHIDDPYDDPLRRLQDILNYRINFNRTSDLAHSTPFSSLHELYRQIIRSCPQANQSTMVAVLEELDVVRDYFAQDTTSNALNIVDRLTGRAPGRGIKALRPLHALIRLSSNDGNSIDKTTFYYHSSFAEFLKQQPQLLPDVTLNVQKGVRRLLVGCLKSLSAITMNGQVGEEHVNFSMAYWPTLWSAWELIEDPDPSSLLRALLAVDFTPSFVQSTKNPRTSVGMMRILHNLYQPTQNFVVFCKSYPGCAPLAEDAVTHLRASAEGAFVYLMDPDNLTGHLGVFDWLAVCLESYVTSTGDCPSAFNSVVRASRGLLEKQEALFEKLEQLVQGRLPATAKMFKLARQGAEECNIHTVTSPSV